MVENSAKNANGYGHWAIQFNGVPFYASGDFSPLHPHHALSRQTTNIKGVKATKMHGLAAQHDRKDVIIISGEDVSHNNVKKLSELIRKILKKESKSVKPSSKKPKEYDMSFPNTTLTGTTHESSGGILFVVSDANNHPVMITKRPSSIKDIEGTLLTDVSEYLAHEQHRAAWFVHHDISNDIRHAPDHILPDRSPLTCWPCHRGKMIWSYPSAIR